MQPLTLTHRHAVDSALGQLAKIEGADRVLDLLVEAIARHHRDPRPELELAPDGQPRVQTAVAGRQERHEPLIADTVLAARDAPDLGAARIRIDEPSGDAQHCRLADAVAPADPRDRPGGKGE